MKAIASLPGELPQVFFLDPEILEVSRDSVSRFSDSPATPENRAWVGSADGRCHAVGYFARTAFSGNSRLAALKREVAIPKALAMLWLLRVRYDLSADFSVRLVVLLPPGEMSGRAKFVSELVAAAREFHCPDGQMSVDIQMPQCRPEGSGIFVHLLMRDREYVCRNDVAIVMVGHRNTSCLLSQRGTLSQARTCDLGFAACARKVAARTGLDESVLTTAIATWLTTKSDGSLEGLCRASSYTDRREELGQIQRAIAQSREEYLAELRATLSEWVPRSVEAAVWCGGTAQMLSRHVSDLLPGVSSRWHGGVELPDGVDDLGLGPRLFDAFGAYENLHVRAKQEAIA